MADNTTITPGSGATIAADDVGGGVLVQRVKVTQGADGTATDVSSANPLPVTGSGDVANGATDSGNPIKIGGKANSAAPTPVSAGQRVDAWRDLYGRAVISDYDPEWGFSSALTTLRDRQSAQRYTILADSVADGFATFWSTTTASGGTAAVSIGEGLLQSGTTAGGTAQMVSTTPAYLPGQVAWFNSAIRFGDTGVAGSTLRIGAASVTGTTPQDGFYYELSGTTFNAVVVKAGVATAVASTSWTKFSTSPFTLDASYHQFEIRWTANRVDFLVDNVLRHTVAGTTSPITQTLNFPMFAQVVGTAGGVNRVLALRNVGIGRFGTPETMSSAGALSIAKAEDSASADADVGIAAMAVRKATPANTSSTDGDYEMLQMSAGRLWTSSTIDSALPAGANTIGAVNIAASQTLATVTTVGAVTSITNALPAGTNQIGALLPATLVVTAVSGANATVTATLPAVAGQFHYISRIVIERVATTAIVGSAVLTYTSTNLPGSWARTTGNAAPVGQQMKDVDEMLGPELKSSVANTNTTIVAPAAGATGIIRITVYYRTAA